MHGSLPVYVRVCTAPHTAKEAHLIWGFSASTRSVGTTATAMGRRALPPCPGRMDRSRWRPAGGSHGRRRARGSASYRPLTSDGGLPRAPDNWVQALHCFTTGSDLDGVVMNEPSEQQYSSLHSVRCSIMPPERSACIARRSLPSRRLCSPLASSGPIGVTASSRSAGDGTVVQSSRPGGGPVLGGRGGSLGRRRSRATSPTRWPTSRSTRRSPLAG